MCRFSVALLVIEHEHNAERAAGGGSGAGALESKEASLAGLLEATVAMSAVAHETEQWETGCGGS